MANTNNNRGQGSSEEERRRGGQNQDSNTSNFANDPEKAREAGRKGGMNRGDSDDENK